MAELADRELERRKYIAAYAVPKNDPWRRYYACGGWRLKQARRYLSEYAERGPLLDVGCGRGEVLDIARELGWREVHGTEIVPELIGGDVVFAWSDELPFDDDSMETVTSFDVLEHIPPHRTLPTLMEFLRVCRWRMILTINNSSDCRDDVGELHINRRPYPEWDAILHAAFAGWRVTWRSAEGMATPPTEGQSQVWEVMRCSS